MADSKLTNLPVKATLDGTEELYINDTSTNPGTDKKLTIDQILRERSLKRVPNLATLQALSPTSNEWVYVEGRFTPADGFEGVFRNDAADDITAEDNGRVFMHASTGRWNRVNAGEISVKWYGATGDGITDDTASIQQCLNSQSGQATVVFPHGTYFISSQIIVTNSVILLGSKDVVIDAVSTAGNLTFQKSFRVQGLQFQNFIVNIINFEPANNIEDYIEIIDCEFRDNISYCFRSLNTTAGDKVNRVSIQNNVVSNVKRGGFIVDLIVENADISHNKIFDCPNNHATKGGRAIQVGANQLEELTNNVLIADNSFDGLSSSSLPDLECQAILVYGTRVIVRGNRFKGMVANGTEHEMIYLKALDSVIDGNVIDSAGCSGDAAIQIKNAALSKRCVVSNNVIYDSSPTPISRAIKVTGSVIVSGNNIENTRLGITVFNDINNDSHETIISNNIVKIADASGTILSLYIVDDAIITGNIFDSPCEDQYGIRIQGDGVNKTKQIIFSNNIVRHKAVDANSPLQFDSGAENIKISDNDFWTGSYIKSQGATGNVTITNNRVFDHPEISSSRVRSFFDMSATNDSGATLRFSGNSLTSSGDMNNANTFARFNTFVISDNEITSTSTVAPYEISSSFSITPQSIGSDSCLIERNTIHKNANSLMKNKVQVNGGLFSVFELRNNYFNGSSIIINWGSSPTVNRWKATDNSVFGTTISAPLTVVDPPINRNND